MSVTATIKSVEKARVIATGEDYLDVTIEITEGKAKEVVKRGYPIDTPTKEIKAELKKLLKTRTAEATQAETQAVLDKQDAATAKAITELEGLEVTDK